VNDARTGAQRDALYVNMLTPDELEAAVFHNSVVVLPALVTSLGLSSEKPEFAWAVRTHSAAGTSADRTAWVRFDPSRPALDTALGYEGLPAFPGGSPVQVRVDRDLAAQGKLPDLLLLHHANVAGRRFEIVSVAGAQPAGVGDLALDVLAPASLAPGVRRTVELVVDNRSAVAAEGVTVTAQLSGASLAEASATRGACAEGPSCALGALAAGASVRVRLDVVPDGSGPVTIAAKVAAAASCDADPKDDARTLAIPLAAATASAPELEAGGGCATRAGARGASVPLLAALSALVARVRRRRARA
jgi:hypothetical protein